MFKIKRTRKVDAETRELIEQAILLADRMASPDGRAIISVLSKIR